MKYINHFSEHSEAYQKFRPDYPDELYQFLVSVVKERQLAWDCGTGNGQAAVKLADYFDQVIATDISQQQLDAAIRKNNVYYHAWPAEKTGLADASVNLVTVAQALHWFKLEEFYQEVRRVSKPGGLIAAWSYSLGKIKPAVDIVIQHLYADILGEQFWPKERQYIDAKYQTIYFPFATIETPEFFIKKKLTFPALIGYLNTWSAVKEYQKLNHKNPVDIVYSDLQNAWGGLECEYIMHWPIHLLGGYVK